MSWLFGSEVDLSSAERAIDQLSKDRDASQDKVTKLQEQAQQQKRRIEDWQRKMEAALNTDEQAQKTLDNAKLALQQKSSEIESVKQRLAQASTIFSLQEEAERLAAEFKQKKNILFPPPIVLAGPTAAGKATLISRLLSEFGAKVALPICHTSRRPLPGEAHGVHFWFSDKAEMTAAAKKGFFLEIAELDNDLYGTSLDAVTAMQKLGVIAVMSLDLAGARQLQASGVKSINIWVHPASAESIRTRMPPQATPQEVAHTIALAKQDMQEAQKLGAGVFKYTIENEDIDTAYRSLRTIVLQLIGVSPVSPATPATPPTPAEIPGSPESPRSPGSASPCRTYHTPGTAPSATSSSAPTPVPFSRKDDFSGFFAPRTPKSQTEGSNAGNVQGDRGSSSGAGGGVGGRNPITPKGGGNTGVCIGK